MLTKSYINLSRVAAILAFIFFIFWLNANWAGASAGPRRQQHGPPASSKSSNNNKVSTPGKTQERPDSVASLTAQAAQDGKVQVPDKLVAGAPGIVTESESASPSKTPESGAKHHAGAGNDGSRGGRDNGELRVAVVTFTTSEKSYTWLSLKNKNAYTKKHNYTLIVDYEAPEKRGVMWHKFAMIEDVIREGKHDWIWWIDFDTLFTNMTSKVESVIEEGLAGLADKKERDKVDFLLTPDCFELNAGSMLVRSRLSAISFFDTVRTYHNTHNDKSEQDCMRDVIKASASPSSPQHRAQKAIGWHDPPATPNEDGGKMHHHKQVVMIPQHRTNAFPQEIKCYEESERTWQKGDLLIHFAGAWAHMKEDDPTGLLMRKYGGLVVEGDEWMKDQGEREDEREN